MNKEHNVLAHERLDEILIEKAIRVSGDEFVIVRRPFRWKKNGQVIPNAYESFRLETVCEDNHWKIVETYGGHIAIVKPK